MIFATLRWWRVYRWWWNGIEPILGSWRKKKRHSRPVDGWMDGWMGAVYIWGERITDGWNLACGIAMMEKGFFFVPYKSCDSRIEWKNICVSFIYIQYWSIDFLDPSYWFCMSFFTFGQVDDVQKRGNKRNKRLDKKDKTFFVWTFAASVAGPVFVYWGGDSLNAPGWVKANEHALTSPIFSCEIRQLEKKQLASIWHCGAVGFFWTTSLLPVVFIYLSEMSTCPFSFTGAFFCCFFQKKIMQHPSTILRVACLLLCLLHNNNYNTEIPVCVQCCSILLSSFHPCRRALSAPLSLCLWYFIFPL